MSHKKVLVIGSGGREHALAWALSRSPQVEMVFVAPGNAGTEWGVHRSASGLQPRAPARNITIAVDDLEALTAFARERAIDLTVVGPEVPLAAGIVDAFLALGLTIFGPTKAAAKLEASKAFAKEFMRIHDIPTADYGIFQEYNQAVDFLSNFHPEAVIKADGLAAGKGVLICDNREQAEAALRTIMVERAFGAAGDRVIIEERLTGREISVLAFSDGQTVVPMRLARDYKRSHDGDTGLNTGGMGAFAPTEDVPPALLDEIMATIMQPVIENMAASGTPYIGVLYAGLMLTEDGPRVLEFNCRFGDPETQVILPLLETDLYDILSACISRSLDTVEVKWRPQSCAAIVLASGGYPESYAKGFRITGLDTLASTDDVIAFHAGTAFQDGQIVTAGGRVMAITALGTDLTESLQHAYNAAAAINFKDKHYRTDIGRVYAERVER